MTESVLKKARNAFHRSNSGSIYLREEEVGKIETYLGSKRNILHICGNPGAGKTFVVLNTVSCIEHTYVNFFRSPKILSKIKASNTPCFIIDEFDKYEQERAGECKNLIAYVLENKKKLITISNYLNRNENVLFFKPYLPEEIEKIVLLKLQNEVGKDVLDTCKIKILSKKFPTGDIRQVYEHCIKLICGKKPASNNIGEHEPNIHKRMIRELIEGTSVRKKNDIFAKYLEKCKRLNIPACDRSDFSCIYDFFE